MAEYGLGNFLYNVTFDGRTANYVFRDPEDHENVVEVSVSREEFPEGITQADSRQVADVAYALAAKELNDKRDARLKSEAVSATEAQQETEAQQREVANDFFDKSEELGDHSPTGEVQPELPADQLAPSHEPTDRENDEVAQADSQPAEEDKSDKKKK